jgi:excisionase family DNA binding protein
MTTQGVADLLNVSRPFVVKLIDDGKLNSFKVGNHRRVREVDALEYRKEMRSEQKHALDELAEETQSLGIKFK